MKMEVDLVPGVPRDDSKARMVVVPITSNGWEIEEANVGEMV